MPNDLLQQLQVTVDDCRKLARLIDDPHTARRLLRLAGELEAHLEKAARAGLRAISREPRRSGAEIDE
ncbi:MAG TPA: hypothetical protein VFH89_09470 [Sphingomicrobium sp.]|nr:hypothetical protein [Sphingomicrobium sp.]